LGAAALHRYDPRCFGCGFNLALGHVGSLSISWPYLIAAGLEAVISNQTKNDQNQRGYQRNENYPLHSCKKSQTALSHNLV